MRGSNKDEARQKYLLHEVLTEIIIVQPIMLSYPLSISMIYPQGIDRNNILFSAFIFL